jgi:PEP-CTERM motif
VLTQSPKLVQSPQLKGFSPPIKHKKELLIFMINGTVRHSFTAIAVTALLLSSASFASAAEHRGLKRAARHAQHMARLGLAVPDAPDAVSFNDSFTYPDGNLVGQGGWVQNGATATNPIQVASGHAVIGPTGQDVLHTLSAPVTHTDGSSVFAAFDLTLTAGSAAGDYFFNYIAGGGNDERVFAINSGAGYTLGLMSSTGDATTFGSTVLSLNTTYRVVITWNFVAGATNDTMSIYINPTDPTNEGNNTAYLNYTWSAAGAAEPTSVASVNLRQGAAGPTQNLDNLFVGTTFADVAIPEPATSMLIGVGLLLVAQRFVRRKKS